MRYVALLRGINVGGNNKVSMARLKEAFEEAGHANVRTYINSGNVVFDAPRAKTTDLAAAIEDAIERDFGFRTKVLVLPGSRVEAIAAELPERWLADDQSRSNVLYLFPGPGGKEVRETLEPADPEHEEVRLVTGAVLSRVAYSFVNRSALHKFAGSKLTAHVTIRNANTARKLAAMVAED